MKGQETAHINFFEYFYVDAKVILFQDPMKHPILTMILLIAVLGTSNGQEYTSTHINKTDAEGNRHGYWKVYDGNGNKKLEGVFDHGKPVGELKFFYPNGKLEALIDYQDDGHTVYATMYHANGTKLAKGKYYNEQKDSTWLYYSEEDGSLSAEEYYISGKAEGTWKNYYPSGQVAEEITYQEGVKQGPWTQFFSDGAVKSKGNYVEGRLDGRFVIFHLDGNVHVSGNYLSGEKDGTWVYLNEIGELEKKEVYKKGKLISQEVRENSESQ